MGWEMLIGMVWVERNGKEGRMHINVRGRSRMKYSLKWYNLYETVKCGVHDMGAMM